MDDRTILIDTGKSKLWTISNFTEDIYDDLVDLYCEHEPEITVWGKLCHQKRDVGFYSDVSNGYKYSSTISRSHSLSEQPLLTELLTELNKYLETNFNGILVNRYKNGTKHIGAHSDDESGLSKKDKMVAALAYDRNGTRTFRIRNKKTKEIVLDIQHEPCMLIVMEGEFQKEFTHEIPIQKRVSGERISLTFREHIE